MEPLYGTVFVFRSNHVSALGSSTNTQQFRTVKRSFTRLLDWFPPFFAVAFWAPAWRCFLASLTCRCPTHISTSLERSKVCFANCSISIFVVFLENYACFIIQAKTFLNCNINILFLSVSLLTEAPRGDRTQSRNQSNEPPLGDSLLFTSDSMPLLSPTLPRDPKGGGLNWLVHKLVIFVESRDA